MKLQESFLCKSKNMDFIQQLFLFRVSLHAVFGAADCRSRRSDVEPGCAVPCLQAEEGTRTSRGSLMNVCRSLTQ